MDLLSSVVRCLLGALLKSHFHSGSYFFVVEKLLRNGAEFGQKIACFTRVIYSYTSSSRNYIFGTQNNKKTMNIMGTIWTL